jgi:hypothetical protein
VPVILERMRLIQGVWHGRLLVLTLLFTFLAASGVSLGCTLPADASVPAKTHCGDCPDRPSNNTCAGASLCTFAGTAVMKPDFTVVPRIAGTAGRIDSEQSLPASIVLVPPNPPPIRG